MGCLYLGAMEFLEFCFLHLYLHCFWLWFGVSKRSFMEYILLHASARWDYHGDLLDNVNMPAKGPENQP